MNLGRRRLCSGDVRFKGPAYSGTCPPVRASGLPSADYFQGAGFATNGCRYAKTPHSQRDARVTHRPQCLVISANTPKHALGNKQSHASLSWCRYSGSAAVSAVLLLWPAVICGCTHAGDASWRFRSQHRKVHRWWTQQGDEMREAAQRQPPLAGKLPPGLSRKSQATRDRTCRFRESLKQRTTRSQMYAATLPFSFGLLFTPDSGWASS